MNMVMLSRVKGRHPFRKIGVKMRKLALFLVPFILLGGSAFPQAKKGASPEEEQKLVAYLKSHWKSPEDYVVEKFSDHDIVFIGEYHRIRHDVELIHNLIPRLYKAGVYNLGIEFGCYEYQDKVDRLITADKYEEDLARWLQFKQYVMWGYKEYEDIYRKAWELNQTLPAGAPKFRVVGLGYRADWTALKENMTREQWQNVWLKGDPDEYMGQTVLREFVNQGKKALIYSGSHHAFTHYQQPIYDFEKKKFIRFNGNRMGNIVYAQIPNRVFNIFLHSPWASRAGFEEGIYPVGGAIDRVMSGFRDQRVGFDVKGSPFGALPDDQSYYSVGYPQFTLSTFCDGYIFQKRLKDYEGCTVDEAFITNDNLQEAIDNLPTLPGRKGVKKPEDLQDSMRKDADFRWRFRNLESVLPAVSVERH